MLLLIVQLPQKKGIQYLINNYWYDIERPEDPENVAASPLHRQRALQDLKWTTVLRDIDIII